MSTVRLPCAIPLLPALLLLICFLTPVVLTAQLSALKTVRTYTPPKTAAAPAIDGDLSDEVWGTVPVAKDFITQSPEFGKPPSRQTEVRVTYDNTAIYVAAHMHDPDPAGIAREMSPRDESANADDFIVGLDTYDDGQNAFRFIITAAGVQSDGKMSQNNYNRDWDAVWESSVQITDDGWNAELKIPYSALRFPQKDAQQWGLQFGRTIKHTGEFVTWSPVDPKINGAINQWGKMLDVKQITPPLRLSLLPYLAVSAERVPASGTTGGGTQYNTSRSFSGGLDLKYGINESFTLDMTLVPDFAQVQSDNVVLNLSPFETRYDEKRPFFTEGVELFTKADIFYSRRIGGLPAGYFDAASRLDTNEQLIRNPAQTQLYNATKLSGRTSGGLGIGLLNAVSAPAYATARRAGTGDERRIRTADLTNYNVLVFDQTLPNNSSVSLTNTNVLREGTARDANVTVGTFDLREGSNTYQAIGRAGLSLVNAPAEGLNKQTGFTYKVGLSKISGNFQFDLSHGITDDKYDPNDLGILYNNNEVTNFAGVKYLEYQPSGSLLNWSTYLGLEHSMMFTPLQFQTMNLNIGADLQFDNFWGGGIFFTDKPVKYYDYYESRIPGRKYHHHTYWFTNLYFYSDSRKDVQVNGGLEYGDAPGPDNPYIGLSLNPVIRFSDRFAVGEEFSINKDYKSLGYVNYEPSTDVITFGRRDVFNITNTLGARYIFTPFMSLSVRTRLYWKNVAYDSVFYTLEQSGDLTPSSYRANHDLNFNAFNIDLLYTWQFAPGSKLDVVWKQEIIQADAAGSDGFFDNVSKTFKSPARNSLTLKLSYYLDYLRLRTLF